MSSSTRGGAGGGYGRGKTKPSNRQQQYRTEENNPNFSPVPHNHGQASELRRKFGGRRCSRTRRSSRRAAPNPGAKPQLVNDNGGKDDSDGGVHSGLKHEPDCDDLNEKGEDFKTEVYTGDNGKEVDKVGGLNTSDETDDDDPAKRLEELRLSVEEAELSEELVNINNQLQEDELLAMEYIYGDSIVILDNQNGLRCFHVQIHVEVPNGLTINTKIDSADFSYSFKVEYLPPINLACLLPKSYPSNCAPLFTISVQWLNSTKISDLCHKLDSIWQDQSGQEVIYPWVEWLHDCTLSHLGFESEIVLGPYGIKDGQDRRAISGIVSPDIDIPSIKSYNDEQHHENFCRNIQECCICFSEYPGSEFVRLPCQHFFCWKCLKTFSDMNITEGTVLKIHCPESKCDGMIPPGLLKRLIGDEEFERWESLMLQKTLESMSDVVYCPRCETACLEDEDHQAQCSKCYYNFCTLCREKRHVGVACMNPEMKLLILQDRQNSTLIKAEQKRREADIINQLLNIREILSFAKQCPSCKMAISRTEGCNKMVCKNCGNYFCYRCNKAITGYEHFRNGQCELFAGGEIQRWEGRMNDRQVMAQIRAEMFGNNAHPCPLCGQNNAKVGNNNHIFCWACQNHYCYLCRKMVRRGSQHYRPNGCKQHTAG